MSTRATINFMKGEQIVAKIYNHSDGYPKGLGCDIFKFFKEVKKQTRDTRFNDASYLAAKWVAYKAGEYSDKSGPLNFLGIGILNEDPLDIEYTYDIDCCNHDKKDFPIVKAYSIDYIWDTGNIESKELVNIPRGK